MKKKELKEILLNNVGWKLLSLIIAAVAWVVIVNIDNPVVTKTINGVPVEITNESAIQEKDKVYDVIEGSTVSIYIKGKRKTVDSISVSDLKATADLSELSNWNAVPIIVSCPSHKELDVSLTGDVQSLKIKLEDKVTKQFQVVVTPVGSVMEGYFIGTTEAKPNLIKVSGGRSVINRIAEIRAQLDVEDASDTVERVLKPVAYDDEGERIESDTLVFGNSKVRVRATVLPTKTVPIHVSTVGSAADGYYASVIEYEPKELLLAGESDVLSEVTEIPIEVDLEKTAVDKEVSVALSDLLPEGVQIADNNQTVSIKIVVEKMSEKEYSIPIDALVFRNVRPDLEVERNLMSSYMTVRVRGIPRQLSSLEEDDFLPVIDLKDCLEGDYTRQVEFEDLPFGIDVIQAPSISLTLVANSENSEEESEEPEETEDQENQDSENDTGSTEQPSQTVTPEATDTPTPTVTPTPTSQATETTEPDGGENTATPSDVPAVKEEDEEAQEVLSPEVQP